MVIILYDILINTNIIIMFSYLRNKFYDRKKKIDHTKYNYTYDELLQCINNISFDLAKIVCDYTIQYDFRIIKYINIDTSCKHLTNFHVQYDDIQKLIFIRNNNKIDTKIFDVKTFADFHHFLVAEDKKRIIFILVSSYGHIRIYTHNLIKNYESEYPILYSYILNKFWSKIFNFVISNNKLYLYVKYGIKYKIYEIDLDSSDDDPKSIYSCDHQFDFHVSNNKMYIYKTKLLEMYNITDSNTFLIEFYDFPDLYKYYHKLGPVFFCEINNCIVLYIVIVSEKLIYEYNINSCEGIFYSFDVPKDMRIHNIEKVIYDNKSYKIFIDDRIYFCQKHII